MRDAERDERRRERSERSPRRDFRHGFRSNGNRTNVPEVAKAPTGAVSVQMGAVQKVDGDLGLGVRDGSENAPKVPEVSSSTTGLESTYEVSSTSSSGLPEGNGIEQKGGNTQSGGVAISDAVLEAILLADSDEDPYMGGNEESIAMGSMPNESVLVLGLNDHDDLLLGDD